MRFSELTAWWQARRETRELRRSRNADSGAELLELLDEASGFSPRRSG